ncbi:MAG: PAS domain S-box protein, partial [Marinoscillum sp.]
MPLKNFNISTSIPADQDNLNKIEALANIGSFQWDATTDQLEWSEHLYRIYGYEPFSVEPTFSFFLDHLEETCRLEFIEALDRHVVTGHEFQFMERIIKSDGSYALLQSQIKPVLNDLKELVQVIGVCRDVTELTLKDEQLKSQKQYFEDVLDQLPVAIMIVDVEGNFHNYNDKFIEIFGTPDGIMPNAKKAMRVQESDLDFLMEMNRKCLEHQTTLTFSRWIQFNDSERRNILFINRPLTNNYRLSQCSVLTIGIDQTKEATLKENLTTNEERLTVAS